MKNLYFIVLVLATCFSFDVFSQDFKVVKISGVVVDADTIVTIPFTSVAIKNKPGGTISDNSGYFSLLVNVKDTIEFSAVGYKKGFFIVPAKLNGENYSMIQLLKKDTILLKEVKVFAWPDEDGFVKAFHDLELPKGQEERIYDAKKELEKVLKEQYEKDKFYYDQMRYSKLYNTTGIVPPNNFLNPITWTNFISDWRNGEFRKRNR